MLDVNVESHWKPNEYRVALTDFFFLCVCTATLAQLALALLFYKAHSAPRSSLVCVYMCVLLLSVNLHDSHALKIMMAVAKNNGYTAGIH